MTDRPIDVALHSIKSNLKVLAEVGRDKLAQVDGRRRNARGQRTRDRILEVTRVAMATGDFRPTIESVRKGTGLSLRSVFGHFGTVERLHRAAIGDPKTYDAIVALIVREPGLAAALSLADRDRIVRAAVFGKA